MSKEAITEQIDRKYESIIRSYGSRVTKREQELDFVFKCDVVISHLENKLKRLQDTYDFLRKQKDEDIPADIPSDPVSVFANDAGGGRRVIKKPDGLS